MRLSQSVVYTYPDGREAAAIVTKVHEGGTCDLVVFEPGRKPDHARNVEHAAGPGCYVPAA